MKYSYLLLFCFVLSAQAEVYRWVDSNGTVIYSDQPHTGAETIELDTSPSYSPVAIPEQATPIEEVAAPSYKISIVSPVNDEAVRNNAGIVNINASVNPQLESNRNDLFTVKLDGQVLGEPSSSPNFVLTNIERGTHTVQVAIVDTNGKQLTSSEVITFHLKRHSVAQ